MDNIRTLHNEAMDIVQMAQIAKTEGNAEKAKAMFAEAFAKEQAAALMAYEQQHPQPGLAILLQSAAHLAVTCAKKRDAEKLAGLALSGDIPEEIAHDLRQLVSSLYTAGNDSFDVYQLKVPSNDSNILNALHIMLERLGCSLQKVSSVNKNIAVF